MPIIAYLHWTVSTSLLSILFQCPDRDLFGLPSNSQKRRVPFLPSPSRSSLLLHSRRRRRCLSGNHHRCCRSGATLRRRSCASFPCSSFSAVSSLFTLLFCSLFPPSPYHSAEEPKPATRIMASKAEGKEPVNEQAVANIYAAMRSELNQIYSKITELEMEVGEHSLVINAIQPLDPSRRCYRMIGGVLVERTINEVLPAVLRNKEGLEEVIARLNEALEKKKKEIAEFEAKYKIRIRKADAEVKDESGRKEGSAQGVLVGPASGSE